MLPHLLFAQLIVPAPASGPCKITHLLPLQGLHSMPQARLLRCHVAQACPCLLQLRAQAGLLREFATQRGLCRFQLAAQLSMLLQHFLGAGVPVA